MVNGDVLFCFKIHKYPTFTIIFQYSSFTIRRVSNSILYYEFVSIASKYHTIQSNKLVFKYDFKVLV